LCGATERVCVQVCESLSLKLLYTWCVVSALPLPSANLSALLPFFSTAPALLRALLRPRPRRPVAVLSARASRQPAGWSGLGGFGKPMEEYPFPYPSLGIQILCPKSNYKVSAYALEISNP